VSIYSRAAWWRLALVALPLALAWLLAGCSSSSDPTISQPSPTASARPASSTTQTPAFPNSVTGTTADQQGNTARVTVGVGTPEPLSKLSDPTPTTCNQAIASDGQSVSGAVAIPLHVSAELTSTLKAPLNVALGEVFSIEPQSHAVQPLSNNTSLKLLWASAYTNSEPLCPTIAEVKWSAEVLTPNVPATWEPWLVIAGAIAPNDPTGEQVVNQLLIRPGASVGSGPGNGDLTPQGSGWVDCSVDESIAGPHNEPFLAVDPTVAEANGCAASG
jgi:hypothetical protein